MSGTPTKAACPICGKPRAQRYRPFCSRRCADVDLHRWLGGAYAVPAVEEDAPDVTDLPRPDVTDLPRDDSRGDPHET